MKQTKVDFTERAVPTLSPEGMTRLLGQTSPSTEPPSANTSRVGGRRIRKQDDFAYRTTLKRCRARVVIDGVVFSCSAAPQGSHPHLSHAEKGLIKQNKRPDIEYTITWEVSEPPKVIRNASRK